MSQFNYRYDTSVFTSPDFSFEQFIKRIYHLDGRSGNGIGGPERLLDLYQFCANVEEYGMPYPPVKGRDRDRDILDSVYKMAILLINDFDYIAPIECLNQLLSLVYNKMGFDVNKGAFCRLKTSSLSKNQKKMHHMTMDKLSLNPTLYNLTKERVRYGEKIYQLVKENFQEQWNIEKNDDVKIINNLEYIEEKMNECSRMT